jgi:hypothetical protein
MITPEQSIFLTVAVLLVLIGAVATLALLRVRALSRRMDELEAHLQRSAEHMQGFSAGAVGQGELIARVEQDLSRLRTRFDQIAASNEGDGAAFNQAIRMARKGCSAEEIIDTCGLSRVEADLVVVLHQQSGLGQ